MKDTVGICSQQGANALCQRAYIGLPVSGLFDMPTIYPIQTWSKNVCTGDGSEKTQVIKDLKGLQGLKGFVIVTLKLLHECGFSKLKYSRAKNKFHDKFVDRFFQFK